MAEIRVNVTASKSQRVNVSSSNIATEISATPDTSQFYSNLSKNWAIAENIVNNQDYSSKHYAQESKQFSEIAESYKNTAEQTYVNFSEQATNASNELSELREASVQEINTVVADGKTEINNTKTTILQDIEFVADGEKEEIRDLANDIKENASDIINRISLSMFDTILKDHVLTYEESKGLALQGTYVYKNAVAGERWGYSDFYNKVVEEYNQATTTETVNGVTVKVHSNGHKFYDIANKTGIDDFFNTMGSAWFYGVDTENERIFLPRNNYFEQATGNVSEVGKSIEAGLPNITGSVSSGLGYLSSGNGAFTALTSAKDWQGTGSASALKSFDFNASRSSEVYGKSTTVQPNAVKKLLYICVGNTVSDTSWVDVVTQVQGGVKDLEDKKNASIAEIDANAKSYNNLTNRQITNCITEIPQRIKLELNNGTLTLKAGSEVIVPNGFETDGKTPKFDYVTVENDLSWVASTTAGTRLAFKSGNYCAGYVSTYCYSGNTEKMNSTSAVTYGRFYNTETNKMYKGDGTNWVETIDSLPIGIFTNDTTGTVTSLNQVFNGIGYIGSIKWLDKGVKLLCANGRNEDGTLKNIEVVTQKIDIITGGTAQTEYVDFYDATEDRVTRISQRKNTLVANSLSELDAYASKYAVAYIVPENKLYWKPADGTWAHFIGACVGSHVHSDANGTVSELKPRFPFRAVDVNEMQEVQCVVETYKNGTSWYRVWSDGWCEQGGRANGTSAVTVKLLKAFLNTDYSVTISGIENGTSTANITVQYAGARSLTTTSFIVQTSSSMSNQCWYACGYTK